MEKLLLKFCGPNLKRLVEFHSLCSHFRRCFSSKPSGFVHKDYNAAFLGILLVLKNQGARTVSAVSSRAEVVVSSQWMQHLQ